MKRMQCEACGSSDIRKISDDIFECQSCGVQYEKSQIQKLLVEIDGEVKIDHSGDIENALKRAAQFLSEGDSGKALEYYNKVLDLDPDNEAALQAVSAIRERNKSAAEEKREKERICASYISVVKHTVSPKRGVILFLEALRHAPDVAPDIFKEISVVSTTQGYYPFSIEWESYSGEYDGIACYRKRVPYTEYRTVTDYHNRNQDGTFREKQEAVTSYREEIDRKPVNGKFSDIYHRGTYIASKKLSAQFSQISPRQFDSTLHNDLVRKGVYKTYWNDALLQMLEQQADQNSFDWSKNLIRQPDDALQQIDSIAIFKEDEDTTWEGWGGRRSSLQYNAVLRQADKQIPGDFHENIHHHLSKESGDVKTIYVPIQVIYYTYHGNPYQAAMILTQENCFAFSYPRFVKKEESQPKELKKTSGSSKSTLPYLIGLYAFFVFCLIKASGAGSNQESTIWLVLGFCAGIPAVIWQLISSTRKKARLTTKNPQETDKILEESEQTTSELELEYQAFLETLTNTKSVEAAVAAAKNSDLKKVMDLHTNL